MTKKSDKLEFQPDDIVCLKYDASSHVDSSTIPRYIVSIQYPYDMNSTCAGKVSCNRFTYSKVHQLCEELYGKVNGEKIIESIHKILSDNWGSHWFYELHEKYMFNPEQLELLYREEKQ